MNIKHATLILIATGSALAGPTGLADETSATNEMAAGFETALSDSALSEYRGGASITNINDLDAALYENSALDTVTGGNFVTDGALAGSSGFATLIQNSGNNVLIQNALILNLQVQ